MTNRQAIKRITLIAMVIYLIATLIGLIFIRGVKFGSFGTSATGDDLASEVTGDLIYNIGGDFSCFGYSIPLIEGKTYFQTQRTGTVDSDEIMNQIEAGKIEHSGISWKIQWFAFLLRFLQTWLIVGGLFWMRQKWVSLPKTQY